MDGIFKLLTTGSVNPDTLSEQEKNLIHNGGPSVWYYVTEVSVTNTDIVLEQVNNVLEVPKYSKLFWIALQEAAALPRAITYREAVSLFSWSRFVEQTNCFLVVRDMVTSVPVKMGDIPDLLDLGWMYLDLVVSFDDGKFWFYAQSASEPKYDSNAKPDVTLYFDTMFVPNLND